MSAKFDAQELFDADVRATELVLRMLLRERDNLAAADDDAAAFLDDAEALLGPDGPRVSYLFRSLASTAASALRVAALAADVDTSVIARMVLDANVLARLDPGLLGEAGEAGE